MLNDIQKSILKTVSDMTGIPDGAVNIRLDGQKAFRQNSEHIQIVSKTDKDGIDIKIAPFTKSENVHIPVVLSKAGFHDMVYNDFFVGEGADVTIVAGCGIHNCGDCDSEHDGIHTFYIGKNAKVHYIEKHYGEGEGTGKRILNPQTIVYLEEGASIVMDTSQIGGVDDTKRYTKCEANGANSEVQINEKLLTAGDQHAVSEMDVILNGARLIATNSDLTGPTEFGIAPACRSLVAPIELATGRKAYFMGKPNPLMMRTGLHLLGVHSEEAAMVGDRLDTDVIAGMESGLATVLVLSGCTSRTDVNGYPYRPTYILNGVGEIVTG